MAVLHPATTELKNPKSCSNDEVTGMVLSTSHKLRGNARQGSEREMKSQTNSELVSGHCSLVATLPQLPVAALLPQEVRGCSPTRINPHRCTPTSRD